MPVTAPPTVSLWKVLQFNAEDTLSYYMQLMRQGNVIKIPLTINRYLINDPSAIQRVFQTNFENYTKVGTHYRRLTEVLGHGLLTNSGPIWAKRRQDLQPMLYYKNLDRFTDIINNYTQTTLQQWEKLTAQQSYFNLAEELLTLVAKISSAVLFGIELSDEIETAVKLVHIGNSFLTKSLSIAPWFPTLRNLHFRLTQRKLNHILLRAFDTNKIPDMPEPLLEKVVAEYQNKNLSTEDFLGEVKNFFVAGHETTGNALSWTFYCLLQHPDKLQTLREEINQTLANNLPTFEDLQKLTYTDWVLSEALRLYPPIWLIERRALAADELGGYQIPANAFILISPYTIHRHPAYWENPDSFYPERFAPENSSNRNKYAYIPFGTGPRVCIGKQLAMMISKIVLSSILQRFDIKLAQAQKVKPEVLLTLRPKRGIWVNITAKRN